MHWRPLLQILGGLVPRVPRDLRPWVSVMVTPDLIRLTEMALPERIDMWIIGADRLGTGKKVKVKVKGAYSSLQAGLPSPLQELTYDGITQCYLPPGRGDIPAFTPAEAGTRFSDHGGMQG